MSDEIAYMSATELAAAYRDRSLSPVEVVDSLLVRIDKLDPHVHAFITVAHEYARAAALVAEQEIMSTPPEDLDRLCGMPVTVKDLTPTAGVRTTFGLIEELGNIPTEDGLTWSRLKAEGAVLLGKTSTPPLGSLCVTENDIVGRTNNPWDLSRSVGGSSGGAAVALATGLGPLAIGSDGGGSIRVPASYCGVVGLKGSRGRIPLYTEGPIFETVDVVGPMTRTVEDCALMLSVMAGPHPRDPVLAARVWRRLPRPAPGRVARRHTGGLLRRTRPRTDRARRRDGLLCHRLVLRDHAGRQGLDSSKW